MKRYDAVNTNGDPLYATSPDGEMVFYSDVAALVAMNAELVDCVELAIPLLKMWNENWGDNDDLASTNLVKRLEETLAKAKELSHEG